MAVINHRQPEGTASTHGKESEVAQQSTHRAVFQADGEQECCTDAARPAVVAPASCSSSCARCGKFLIGDDLAETPHS
ncbi:Hypothetical predicted protein [Xyrichtys novacula]|uniref:Uncharacterized protein n=1 Tax=Xyrichtys novacula TaxID=13765 RepID=A0AAV1FNM4_XYRNO|nr:Hypothetical predicted protein [Xyrichtys novacula]